jgi:hypothetical protein
MIRLGDSETPTVPARRPAFSVTGDLSNPSLRADLGTCHRCECPLVEPIRWQRVGAHHHQVTLRCPNCEWVRTGVFDQADADELARRAAHAARQLREALAQARSWRVAATAQPHVGGGWAPPPD